MYRSGSRLNTRRTYHIIRYRLPEGRIELKYLTLFKTESLQKTELWVGQYIRQTKGLTSFHYFSLKVGNSRKNVII